MNLDWYKSKKDIIDNTEPIENMCLANTVFIFDKYSYRLFIWWHQYNL